MNYQIGDVVLVDDVVDPQGQRAKCRPMVVLEVADELVGAAITTQFGKPLGMHEILLFDGKMANRTGLTRPCVANADWLTMFGENQVVCKLGHVLPAQLRAIQSYLNKSS